MKTNSLIVEIVRITILIIFFSFSTYLWFCLGVALQYDIYGFNYTKNNYTLIHNLSLLFELSVVVIGICLYVLSSKRRRRTNNTRRKIITIPFALLAAFDLYAAISLFGIHYTLVNKGEYGFMKLCWNYVCSPLLWYNILAVITVIGIILICYRKPKNN